MIMPYSDWELLKKMHTHEPREFMILPCLGWD